MTAPLQLICLLTAIQRSYDGQTTVLFLLGSDASSHRHRLLLTRRAIVAEMWKL